MMRRATAFFPTFAVLVVAGAAAGYAVLKPKASRDAGALLIYGTSQMEVIRPVLEEYRRRHRGTHIHYVDLDGEALYRRALGDVAAGRPGADILLSTAMDLQVKFVNDGYALSYPSTAGRALPPWARWRDEAFGVAFEPAVMVYNTHRLAGRAVPATRAELVEAIRYDPVFWRGGIGTYDLRRRGIGYLLTSQEARQASDFGALMKAFGAASARLEAGSGTMLDQVARGDLVLGYNILESNARRKAATGAPLAIVYPYDFTLAVLRTVVIPRDAAHPDEAKAFVEFLLSPAGQMVMQRKAYFNPVRNTDAPDGSPPQHIAVFHPVPLGPELLVYLDTYKRRRLLANWQSLVSGDPVLGAKAPAKP